MLVLIAFGVVIALSMKGAWAVIKFIRKYFLLREEVKKLRIELFFLTEFYGKERKEERDKEASKDETKKG